MQRNLIARMWLGNYGKQVVSDEFYQLQVSFRVLLTKTGCPWRWNRQRIICQGNLFLNLFFRARIPMSNPNGNLFFARINSMPMSGNNSRCHSSSFAKGKSSWTKLLLSIDHNVYKKICVLIKILPFSLCWHHTVTKQNNFKNLQI
jgi:hypothetical protein